MRKFYFFLFIAFIAIQEKSIAQCNIQLANMVITQPSSPQSINSSKCQFTFNFSFDIVANGGFKYFYMHSWRKDDYPSQPVFNCNSNSAQFPGTSLQYGTAVDDIGKSFLDIGFEGLNSNSFAPNLLIDITSKFATVFDEDPTVVLTQPSNSPGLQAFVTRRGNSDTLHFNIVNIRVILNQSCNSAILGKTDVWAGNANRPDPPAQCRLCSLTHSFNDPQIALIKSCASSPFSYQVGLSSRYPDASPVHVTYKVYLHNPALGNLPSTSDTVVYTSPIIALSENSPFTSAMAPLPHPYCCVDPWSQYSMYVSVVSDEFSNIFQSQIIEPGCAALPVKLRTFNAVRNRGDVKLTWVTETEEKNKGFEVQRKIGGADWVDVSFIQSKAVNGNSNSTLNYELVDNNTVKGISLYRLKQVDIDGKISYSIIRSVRGEGQLSKVIIYPNPSNDGKVSISFEDASGSKDVQLIDVNGRIMRQWKSFMGNNIQIDNLVPGFYSVRIVISETGEQVVEKVIVKNR